MSEPTKMEFCVSSHIRLEPYADEIAEKLAKYRGISKSHFLKLLCEKQLVAEWHEASVLNERLNSLGLAGNNGE